MSSTPRLADWVAGQKHLCKVDPVMMAIAKRVGPCKLKPRRDYFVMLCWAIFNQQISTKVAKVLFARFANQFPRKRPTPHRVIEFLSGDENLIRTCGISRQKRGYLLDLARHFASGQIRTARLRKMDDEQIVQDLIGVKGIGRWTAEMFLIFVLNRTDVYPVDDLGLRKGVQRAYGLKSMPTVKQLTRIAEPWRPYRSLATWYLWKSTAPQVAIP